MADSWNTGVLHVVTPLLESRALSHWLGDGVPVYIKLDCAQPSGSFKIRGIGALCAELVAAGHRHLVSSSGGNAGMAVAHSARVLGVAATVVVPQSTSPLMRERIAQEGARVLVHGAAWDDAHSYAQELAASLGTRVVHPFDDASVWRGHASIISELREQLPQISRGAHRVPTHIFVAVGGGGLLCGVMEGLQAAAEAESDEQVAAAWRSVRVIACETRGADSFAQSLSAGHALTLPAISSIATTLGAKRVSDEALAWTQRAPGQIESRVVSDAAAVRTIETMLHEHRLLVEPACAAAITPLWLSSALGAKEPEAKTGAFVLTPEEKSRAVIVVIVCGGNGVSLELLSQWKRQFGLI